MGWTELMGEGAAAFSEAFRELVGLPWPVATAIIVGLCLCFRLVAILRRDRAEATRRCTLVADCSAFLDETRSTNQRHLDRFESLRREAHVRAHAARQPLDDLRELGDVGPQVWKALWDDGVRTVGDVLARDLLAVRGVEPEQAEALLAHAAGRQERLLAALQRAEGSGALPVVADAGLDRKFDRFRAAVITRQSQLGGDAEALALFASDAVEFRLAAEGESVVASLARWARAAVRSIGRAMSAPRRWLGRLFITAAALALNAHLPLVVGVWDPALLSGAATAGMTLAWCAFVAGVIAWFVLADRPWGARLRAPRADEFADQRLQFIAMTMAHELGIAPPRVLIDAAPAFRAWAVGSPAGPSAVCLSASLVDALSVDEMMAVLGRQVGQLRAGQCRFVGALAAVTAPLALLRRILLGAAFATGYRIAHRPHLLGGRLRWERRLHAASPLWLLAAFVVAPAAAVVVAVDLAFAALRGLAVRSEEFQADAYGARLGGGLEPMALGLQALEQAGRAIVNPRERLEARGFPGTPPRPTEVSLGARAAVAYDRLLVRLALTAPPLAARVQALESGAPRPREFVFATLSAVLAIGLGALLLWSLVAGASAVAAELPPLPPLPW